MRDSSRQLCAHQAPQRAFECELRTSRVARLAGAPASATVTSLITLVVGDRTAEGFAVGGSIEEFNRVYAGYPVDVEQDIHGVVRAMSVASAHVRVTAVISGGRSIGIVVLQL